MGTSSMYRTMIGDARKRARYRVSAPVTFRWAEDGAARMAEGITRDISPTSVFAWSQVWPPSGVELHCEVLLPRMTPSAQAIKVEMKGWVRRVEPPAPERALAGFVIATNRISILSPESDDEADEAINSKIADLE